MEVVTTEILNFIADNINTALKIKDYLSDELGFSSSLITKVKVGGVFINGESVHMRATVNPGDKITIHLPKEKSDGIIPKDIPLDILYEDDLILAVNKPVGMPTHPCRGNSLPTLAEAVMNYYGGDFVFRAVSRLDKDTSGIVIIAKNAYSAAIIGRAMKNGEIEKEYTALISGIPNAPHGFIEAPIERVEEGNVRRWVMPNGKYAKTEYELLSTTPEGNSFVRVKLYTGRTHQIRVHMAYIGHALVGDSLYGNYDSECYKLHCNKISFKFIGKQDFTVTSKPDFYGL